MYNMRGSLTQEAVAAMSTPFLSSEEYDERAHQLYNEGRYEDALAMLREGLGVYPAAVGLHVGVGYARLAREEIAWARRAFDEALALDADHEDALAGLGEVLIKLGQLEQARAVFARTLELGYQDDIELMLQVGRALFREGLAEDARPYFEAAVAHAPDHAEAVSLIGYTQHRLNDDDKAIATLRRSLQLDPEHSEARIYLANLLYDRGEHEAALYHLDRTNPEDHWDELGIWRLMELRRSIHKVADGDPDLRPWEERLADLAGEADEIDELLAEVEATVLEQEERAARTQLELFGTMLVELGDQRRDPSEHRVIARDGRAFRGTWDEIVAQMKDGSRTFAARSLADYMANEARRGFSLTGMVIPTGSAEGFLRGAADAGLLRIIR
ncbi:MAG: tetratricopeptide repeat protein [Gemmatimonadaceae bacterium]|nr:tetratricopeptide repeat protein [Gemmatimonadaceae bacterium]